ncbi:MAG: hypothetical protein KBC96_13010 [Armatimonadetes bacterium]|nr:hypothetical protein [Armatimonadota bacterium]
MRTTAISCSLAAVLLLAGCGGGSDPIVSGGPMLEFTSVPAVGSYAMLTGRALNVKPRDHRVAVFIYAGGWWNKPYWNSPLTAINGDGTWSCDITTGGSDAYAARIAAFIVPAGYAPPTLSGQAEIPSELREISVASLEVVRSGSEVARVIRFSGYDWTVKRSVTPVGPPDAGNFFSDSAENVWLDSAGRLHLKITRRDGRWQCAEVVCERSFGYGTYTFTLASEPTSLGENVVLGLFTWSDSPDYAHRELDVEFSRWGDLHAANSQYVVQPWTEPGNRYRFNIAATGSPSAHGIDWRADRIEFVSRAGGGDLQQWTYAGPDIPAPGGETPRINLWLVNGHLSGSVGVGSAEAVVESFEFE